MYFTCKYDSNDPDSECLLFLGWHTVLSNSRHNDCNKLAPNAM